MKFSNLLASGIRNLPSEDELARMPTERLMERASLVKYSKNPSGYLTFLPLGQRVVREMERLLHDLSEDQDVQEVRLSGVQSSELLKKSNRWEKFEGDIHRLEGTDCILSPTHEESFLDILDSASLSYKGLPLFAYQFNDVRRKLRHQSNRGGLRSAEILVYEGYGLVESEEEMETAFDRFNSIFSEFFSRLGVPFIPHRMRSDFLQYLFETENGLEEIMCTEDGIDRNDCYENTPDLKRRKVLDMGMIFSNDSGLSQCLDFGLTKGDGTIFPYLCSSAIGIYRTLFSLVENYRDEKGMVWPEGFEPFQYVVIPLHPRDGGQTEMAHSIYSDLRDRNKRVLLDDRPKIGTKKRSADLIGIPRKILVFREDGQLTAVEENRDGDVKTYD